MTDIQQLRRRVWLAFYLIGITLASIVLSLFLTGIMGYTPRDVAMIVLIALALELGCVFIGVACEAQELRRAKQGTS